MCRAYITWKVEVNFLAFSALLFVSSDCTSLLSNKTPSKPTLPISYVSLSVESILPTF